MVVGNTYHALRAKCIILFNTSGTKFMLGTGRRGSLSPVCTLSKRGPIGGCQTTNLGLIPKQSSLNWWLDIPLTT